MRLSNLIIALIFMVTGDIGSMVGRKFNRKLDNADVDKLFMGLMTVIICISIYNTICLI